MDPLLPLKVPFLSGFFAALHLLCKELFALVVPTDCDHSLECFGAVFEVLAAADILSCLLGVEFVRIHNPERCPRVQSHLESFFTTGLSALGHKLFEDDAHYLHHVIGQLLCHNAMHNRKCVPCFLHDPLRENYEEQCLFAYFYGIIFCLFGKF